MSIDPLAHSYVYNSPYAFAENKLGLGNEIEGLELGPTWHVYEQAAATAGMTSSQYRKSLETGAANLLKSTSLEVKVGGGWTVGAEVGLGPISVGAYGDAGTYSVGYNTKDGIVDEYTTGSGFELQPLVGVEEGQTIQFPGDGRTGESEVKIEEKSTSQVGLGLKGAGGIANSNIKETTYSATPSGREYNGPNASQYSPFIKHGWSRSEGLSLKQVGLPQQSTQTEIKWATFDIRAIIRVGFEFKTSFSSGGEKREVK